MPGGYLLVIDDSPTVQKVVERALSEAGHRVLAAADGEAALALIHESRAVPELILLDGLIPGRDAADFCRQLTDQPALARVPVVVMIARGQAADLEERFAKATNVVDTIGKPFSPEALQAVVARVVRLPGSLGRTATSAALAEALALSAGPADGAASQARAFAADGLLLAGDLATISLSQIIELLADQLHTGTLRVLNTETSARIELYFQAGRVDFGAAVGVAEELLIGRFTVETGDITPEALTHLLAERARATGPLPLFGADLVARGLISEQALSLALSRQTSELAYETLRWRAGFFQFRGGELPAAAREARLGLNVDRMLLEGYRRVDEWRVIEREIADLDDVFVRNENKIAQLPRGTLTRDELGVLDEIDSRRSVREIVRKLRMGSFDVSKVFFRFSRARLIRRRVRPTSL